MFSKSRAVLGYRACVWPSGRDASLGDGRLELECGVDFVQGGGHPPTHRNEALFFDATLSLTQDDPLEFPLVRPSEIVGLMLRLVVCASAFASGSALQLPAAAHSSQVSSSSRCVNRRQAVSAATSFAALAALVLPHEALANTLPELDAPQSGCA